MSTETVSYANPEWEFCDRLRKVRRSVAEMTQEQMATAIGVSQKAYAAWESGKNQPENIVAVARRVAELWPGRVTPSWLLGVDGGEPPTPPPALPFDHRGIEQRQQLRRLRAVTEVGHNGADDAVDANAARYVAMSENGWLPRVDSNHQPPD